MKLNVLNITKRLNITFYYHVIFPPKIHTPVEPPRLHPVEVFKQVTVEIHATYKIHHYLSVIPLPQSNPPRILKREH